MSSSNRPWLKGNKHGAHDKPWTRALQKYAAQNPNVLAELAEATYLAAKGGDAQARAEIANRLDGKPVQPMEIADITDRTAEELTTDELRRIAASGRDRAIATPSGSRKPN